MAARGADVALLAAGYGGAVFIAGFIVIGALAPGYDGWRDTISALEFTPLARWQQANFLFMGLLQFSFAAGLRIALREGRGAVLIPLLTLVAGIGVIGDAIFIHPPLHLFFDLVSFNAALLVPLLFAWRAWRDPAWRGWPAGSILTALAMMGFLAAFGWANAAGGPAGLFEKLAVGTRTVWSLLFVTRLFTGARP
jgi:hypothetical protein